MGIEFAPEELEQDKKQEMQAGIEELYGTFNHLADEAEASGGKRVENQNEDGVGEHYIEDKNGNRTYEIKYKIKDPKSPDQEVAWYYEDNFTHDDQGRVTTKEGRDVLSENEGNAWKEQYGYGKHGIESKDGVITEGPDEGHKYQTKYYYTEIENVVVRLEKGKILDQGKNPKKQETGHEWAKAQVIEQ